MESGWCFILMMKMVQIHWNHQGLTVKYPQTAMYPIIFDLTLRGNYQSQSSLKTLIDLFRREM